MDARLGRTPSVPDDRNWQASTFLDGPATALDAALDAMLKQHHTNAFKNWARLVTAAAQGNPQPSPNPAPTPPVGVVLADPDQLDQGQTGHCVGFGWSQFLNTLGTDGIDDHYADADGHALYYECKIIDGEPKQENGSSVHSGAKAVKARGRIQGYAWANTISEVEQWLLTKGPVTVGTDWWTTMFDPDPTGLINVGGKVEGGHCYVLDGYDPTTGLFRIQNSWGSSWGQNGYAYISMKDFGTLLDAQGEACVAVELA